jgi:hypothetical protein
MQYRSILIVFMAALLASCVDQKPEELRLSLPTPAVVAADEKPTATVASKSPPAGAEAADELLNTFVPQGAKLVNAQRGDLNRDGQPDAILVIDTQNDGEKAGEGVPRSVVLLVRDASGQLQQAAQNDKIVPCARCGGMMGDPFGYVRIDKGGFTVLNEGGSRERWSNEFTFQYSADKKDWLLSKVVRSAYDTISSQNKITESSQADFGTKEFAAFDPADLPSASID